MDELCFNHVDFEVPMRHASEIFGGVWTPRAYNSREIKGESVDQAPVGEETGEEMAP